MKLFFITLTLFIISLISSSLFAQVTIGSSEKPVAGALLQLTEGATTSRGLGLPRVNLNDLTSLSDIDPANTDRPDPAEHVGLVVYNASNSTCPGIYVWNGDSWEGLGGAPVQMIRLQDASGNTYKAKWFSPDPCDPNQPGKYWMVENMRTIHFNNGALISASQQAPIVPCISNVFVQEINTAADLLLAPNPASYTYMIDKGAGPETQLAATYEDHAKKWGLWYTYDAAKVICPTGWKLPTVAEWDELAAWLGGNALGGKRMKADNYTYAYTDIWGTYSYAWDGFAPGDAQNTGFNALPAGSMYNGSPGSIMSTAYYLVLNTQDIYPEHITIDAGGYYSPGGMGDTSVRCIKE